MLDVPEIVKQRCRSDNNREETVKRLEFAFFESGIDSLYPSNDLHPSDDLYPSDAGTPWLTIGMDRICAETFNLTESLCSGNNIVFGSCEAAKIEFMVADVEEELTGNEFAATLAVGDYKMAYGFYTVSSMVRQADRRKRKITAYDRMIRFDEDVADWYNAQYPTENTTRTVKQLRDSLCAFCGVPQEKAVLINDGLVIGKTIDPQTLNGRDVLKAICEINGTFGHIDRTGQLVYVRLQESGIYPSNTLYPSDGLYPMSGWTQAENLAYYRSITYGDYVTAGIDRIQIRTEEGDIGATSSAVSSGGANTYVIEGNFLTYGLAGSEMARLAQSICDAVGGREYRPAKMVSYAMPWLEVGDGVRAITTDTEICTYVLKRTMKGIQAMSDTIESKGSQTMEQNINIESEITQLKGKTAKIIKSVDEVSVTLSDLEKNTTAQIKTLSDAIVLKVDKGDISNQISVETDGISIEGNRFSWSSTYSSMSSDGKLKATSGEFTGDVIANLFKTTDGSIELSGGKLTITGAEIKGTTNTSTIGCSVLSAQDADIDRLVVNDSSQLQYVSANDVDCDDIQCTKIYSSQAGEWWSDRRLKHDIKSIDPAEALRVVMGLKPVTFIMNGYDEMCMGFVAQDVMELKSRLPLYGTMKNGYYCLPYANYVAILAGALQALIKKNGRLEDAVYAEQ